jgi:hypothetical protein
VSSKFELSQKDAASELLIGQTKLKTWCRDHGIKRWPQRKFTNISEFMKCVKVKCSEN